jgi:ribosomal protein L11 methyltransferase
MAAVRLGAAFALGIDIDPVALECAQELSKMNRFGAELELRAASFDQAGVGDFDAVLANLDGKTLALLCPYLPALVRARGLACLSGLQHQDLEQITDALGKADFRITSRTERQDWLALGVQRNP